jgi:NDP-sugar pyrophosphorylase family protein
MKAMILAAGVGSRLDPLTRNLPKPMVPIANKPVMEHIITNLVRHGFDRIMVNLHHMPELIEGYFGDGGRWGAKITYSRETTLLGTAGSVKHVAGFYDEGTFVVIGGDDLSDFDLTKGLGFHREKGALATIGLSLVDDPSEYGIAIMNDDGRITGFVEKPKGGAIFSNAANTGIYFFEPEILDLIPRGTFYDFGSQLFPLLVNLKPFYGYLTASYWRDIGGLVQYRQAHYDALAGLIELAIPGERRADGVWVGEGTNIDKTVSMEGPALVGDNCRIERKAQVSANSVIGRDCVVEAGATVRESILWDGACVMRDTHIERCVVGTHCKVKSNAAVFDGVIVDPHPHS